MTMSDITKYTEDSYEQTLISLFRDELGYQYVCGYEVERDYREPYYRDELEASLRRLNPQLPEQAIADGLRQLTSISMGSLELNNECFMNWLQNGMEVQTLMPSAKGDIHV